MIGSTRTPQNVQGKSDVNYVLVVLFKSGNHIARSIPFEQIEAALQMYAKAIKGLPESTDGGLVYLVTEGTGMSCTSMGRADQIEGVYWYEKEVNEDKGEKLRNEIMKKQLKMMEDSNDDWKNE